MKNTYNTAELKVVHINRNNVIMTSLNVVNDAQNNMAGDAAGRRFSEYSWDAY